MAFTNETTRQSKRDPSSQHQQKKTGLFTFAPPSSPPVHCPVSEDNASEPKEHPAMGSDNV